MNVCYIAHDSNLTGASRSLLDILSCCPKYNIKPFVILPKPGKIEEYLKDMNVQYKIVRYYSDVKSSSVKNKVKGIVNFFAIRQIMNYIKANNIDILHNNSILVTVGMQAAKNLNLPYICHIREFGVEDHNLEFLNPEKVYNYIEKADKAIVISKSVLNKFKALVPKADFELIYDGVDLKQHGQEDKTILDKENVNLLLAGRICSGKGQEEAIKAVEFLVKKEGLTNITLNIVGDGIKGDTYFENIKKYVEEKSIGEYIKFLPFVKELREMRNKCDIGLVCSRNEAFGRVTVETMLSKELVIGADTGGTKELIDDKINGLLYCQGNFEDLAEKIKIAVNNPEMSRKIAEEGYNHAKEKFLIERNVDEIYRVYKKIKL